MSKQPWYDSDNPVRVARSATWRVGVWLLAIFAFLGLVGVGTWAFKVATSDVKGRGDVISQTNSANNRIFAQQKFEDRYQDILATDRNIDVLAQAVKDDPANPEARTRLVGAKAYCNQVVGRYNADARKVTQAPFRAEDLPYQVDTADPSTDCKESTPR